MARSDPGNCPGRRRFLKQGAGWVAIGAAWTLLPLTTGCGQKDEAPAETGPVEVPLAMVPEGRRTVVDVHGHPVELQREGDLVTARSLRCTHQGCKVQWNEDESLYVCPCHEGKFDASGEVAYGLPRRPLRLFEAVIEGEVIRISS